MKLHFLLILVMMAAAGCQFATENPAGSQSELQFTSAYLREFNNNNNNNNNNNGVDLDSLNIQNGNPSSKDDPAYVILNSLRMLGYNFAQDKTDTSKVSRFVRTVEQFKRDNGLNVDAYEESERVDETTLLLLDQKMVELENGYMMSAAVFPLRDKIISDHPRGLPIDFVASFWVNTLSALPPSLVDFSEQNIISCALLQCAASSGASSFIRDHTNFEELHSRPQNDYYFYDFFLLGPRGSEAANLRSLSDATIRLIHEYAHYLDSAVYAPVEGTTRGTIDTHTFYMISFDGLEETTAFPIYNRLELSYKEGSSNVNFIDNYAMSHAQRRIHTKEGYQTISQIIYVEDFAESFAVYVTDGQTFREKAASDAILQQKYDWLRTHVFNGVEYDTALPRAHSDYSFVFDGQLRKLQ